MRSPHLFKLVKPTGYVDSLPQTRQVIVRPQRQTKVAHVGNSAGLTLIIQMGDKNQSILLNRSEAHDLAVALQYYADELHLENPNVR